MNPRPLRILVACAVVVAALLCWYLLSMEPSATPRRVSGLLASGPRITGHRHRGAPDAVVVEYSRRFLNDGEHEAMTWLMERSAPSQQ